MKTVRRLQQILCARTAPLPILAVLAVQSSLAQDLSDPTRRPSARSAGPGAVSAPTALRLEAILVEADRRLAIVDGKVVRAGDRIADAVITAIHPDSIEYSRGGRTHEAKLQRTEKMPAGMRRSVEE